MNRKEAQNNLPRLPYFSQGGDKSEDEVLTNNMFSTGKVLGIFLSVRMAQGLKE